MSSSLVVRNKEIGGNAKLVSDAVAFLTWKSCLYLQPFARVDIEREECHFGVISVAETQRIGRHNVIDSAEGGSRLQSSWMKRCITMRGVGVRKSR